MRQGWRMARLGALISLCLVAPSGSVRGQQPQQPPQIPTVGDATQAQQSGQQRPLEQWAALAFTASGHHWIVSRLPTREQAEATVRQRCEQARQGECKVAVANMRQCIGLAVWRGANAGRTHTVAVTRGGETTPEAQRNALRDCRTQPNVRSDCTFRAAICGDGR